MKLMTQEIKRKLLRNGELSRKDEDFDPKPVVKLFTPDAGATWLLAWIDPKDEDLAFGLCDLGVGEPELGFVSLTELAGVRGRLGLPIERDLYFTPDKTLVEYYREARSQGRILA